MMKQTHKQLVAQRVLSNHSSIHVGKVTLMYTAKDTTLAKAGKPTIIVSVPKKIVPKATARNYIKRVLRAILRQNLQEAVIIRQDWMWICKESRITPELRAQLISAIKTIPV